MDPSCRLSFEYAKVPLECACPVVSLDSDCRLAPLIDQRHHTFAGHKRNPTGSDLRRALAPFKFERCVGQDASELFCRRMSVVELRNGN